MNSNNNKAPALDSPRPGPYGMQAYRSINNNWANQVSRFRALNPKDFY